MNKQEALDKIEELKKFIERNELIDLDDYVKNLNFSWCKDFRDPIEIISSYDEYKYIKIPMPCANTAWTFEAFDLVKEIVNHLTKKGLNAYPVFDRDNSNRFLFISVKEE